MKEIILFSILSGCVFLVFLALLVFGFIKKSNKIKLIALFMFSISILLIGVASFKIIHKSYKKAAEILKPRKGDEIYDALFDKRQTDCVTILHYQDQVVPKIDYAIWLHFKTCPKELKRILSKHKFAHEKILTTDWKERIAYGETLKWLKPKKLGDTIMVYEFASENGKNIQTIWANLDSTEVYVRDRFD